MLPAQRVAFGVQPVAQSIAQLVALPGEELQARFLELLALGLVDLRAA